MRNFKNDEAEVDSWAFFWRDHGVLHLWNDLRCYLCLSGITFVLLYFPQISLGIKVPKGALSHCSSYVQKWNQTRDDVRVKLSMPQWYCDTVVLWYSGTVIQWYCDTAANESGTMRSLQKFNFTEPGGCCGVPWTQRSKVWFFIALINFINWIVSESANSV